MPKSHVNKRPDSELKLEVTALGVERGGHIILNNLNFVASGGTALTLTGPNGIGKTTLLLALAGFLRANSGQVALTGGDPEQSIGEQCHYVGHANAVKAGFTGRENLEFWQQFLDATPNPADVDQALEATALSAIADSPAGYMSAGQQRRLGLARLLIADRPIWLLDEPTASLDTKSRQLIAAIIDTHLQTGGLAIAATHIPLGLNSEQQLDLSDTSRGSQ